MTTEATTTRIEQEYSTRWCEAHPDIAARDIARGIEHLQSLGMKISFDFSRMGFFTIIGERA